MACGLSVSALDLLAAAAGGFRTTVGYLYLSLYLVASNRLYAPGLPKKSRDQLIAAVQTAAGAQALASTGVVLALLSST